MANPLSPRLAAIVDALPLRPGLRVLEIGCGPGAAARAIAARRLTFRQAAAEEFELEPGEAPYDLALAVRVGALDGRHPEAGRRAILRIAAALTPAGRLLIDGGDPLREIELAGIRGREDGHVAPARAGDAAARSTEDEHDRRRPAADE